MKRIKYDFQAPEIFNLFPFPRGASSDTWHLEEINHGAAARAGVTGAGVRVAVLDTGIYTKHPDFNGAAIFGANFTNEEAPDLNGHGTHVAGLVNQVASGAQIIGVKVLGQTLGGTWPWVEKGVRWCIDNDIRIINMSLGSLSDNWAVRQAVQDAWDAGIIVVASSGNGGTPREFYPAIYPEVVAAGACDSEGRWQLSGLSDEDVITPGSHVFSYWLDGGHKSKSGTSMACPIAAGGLALALERWDYDPDTAITNLLGRMPGDGTTGELLDLRNLLAKYFVYVPSVWVN